MSYFITLNHINLNYIQYDDINYWNYQCDNSSCLSIIQEILRRAFSMI